jgi:hypothetical protein
MEDPQAADWGAWRNTMLFVADDDWQGSVYDQIGQGHMESSEAVAAEVERLRPSIDVRKVYLFEYPWNSAREKPECATALINTINGGVGYVNFFGHGSPILWTDEHVLTPQIITQLSNANEYPVISEFSCCLGQFDLPDPGSETLSQMLLAMPGAGASAIIAATREALPNDNASLGMSLYKHLMDTCQLMVGMALVAAKADDPCSNTSIYVLFGDPALRILPSPRRLQMTIADTAGRVHDTLLGGDTLQEMQALEKVVITGSVLDSSGNTDAQFGATTPAYAHVAIYNPQYITGRTDGGPDTSVRFFLPGTPVFSGNLPVHSGAFRQTVLLPRSLTFDKTGAELLGYAWEPGTIGVGYKNTLYFHGTDSSAQSIKDTTGPQISVRPVYDAAAMRSGATSFTDHIESTLPLQMEILLNDPSGINVVGTGPDEGLTMAITGVQPRTNINSKFQFAAGDYRKGSALIGFESGSLKPGTYPVQLTAQNLLGTVSHLNISLIIDDSDQVNLDHVFNIPNPMRMGQATRFFFSSTVTTTQVTNPAVQADFTIKVYSLAGKLLWVQRNASNGQPWYGRDQTGYALPPDVYLYQVTADFSNVSTADGMAGTQTVKSKIQKLVIYPPK